MKTIAKNDHLQLLTGVPRYNADRLVAHHPKHPDQRAAFAQEMMRTWGMVAARPAVNGEGRDDKGLALLPPAEVVSRACEVAELAFAEFQQRGWLLDVPLFEELTSDDDDD